MKLLFISLLDFDSLKERNIYTDTLRVFVEKGHEVYAISPIEKRKNQKACIIRHRGYVILKPLIGNTQKTNYVEKFVSLLSLESRILSCIKKYLRTVKIDLILYATPPVTINHVIRYMKDKDGALAYLMLKDIWPQGIVDLGSISKKGITSIIYQYLRKKEKTLYKTADYIGCMSEGNLQYLLAHNPGLSRNKLELCPNTMEPTTFHGRESGDEIRLLYGLPLDKTIFIYGGNLGEPQGLDFMIKCITQNRLKHAFFLIIGDGTKYEKLRAAFKRIHNVKMIKQLPKDEYEQIVYASDAGMVFLDSRFTIPNIPSRILSYMNAGKPILAVTDVNTDLKDIILENKIGLWCPHGNEADFEQCVEQLLDENIRYHMGVKSKQLLYDAYTSKRQYEIIMRHFPSA